METVIKTREELNNAIVQLRAYAIQMCNETDSESVCKDFVQAKDLLVAIFKHNAERVSTPINQDKN